MAAIDVSLVLVTFRSRAVAAEAVASFRREAGACGLTAEIIAVDHSRDEDEVRSLRSLADAVIAQPNRGYAAGINRGAADARGRLLLVANPDIRFLDGSLAALTAALDAGWDVVGPRFELGALALPPADVQTPGAELRRWWASRSRAAADAYLVTESRRWRRAWQAQEPVAMPFLSGAALLFRREVLAEVGPWDEAYFLYYEESEWLLRARRRGFRAAFVPGARVAHFWGHAADPVTHAGFFATSRRRYFTTSFPVAGRLAARLEPRALGFPTEVLRDGSVDGGDVLWLVSPSPTGYPAAGWVGGSAPPADEIRAVVVQRGMTGPLTVAAVSVRTERLLGCWRWEG